MAGCRASLRDCGQETGRLRGNQRPSDRGGVAIEFCAVAAVCLGPVKRAISLSDEGVDLFHGGSPQRDVDADGDLNRLIVRFE